MIHNDIIQDHAPAESLGKGEEKKGDKLAGEAGTLDAQALKERKLAVVEKKHLNRRSGLTDKYDALTTRDLHQAHCWDTLFRTTNKVLHLVNIILELIDPEFAMSCHKLSKSVKSDIDKYGHHLARSECHLPGVAYHWNSDAKAADKYHTDRNSAHAGRSIIQFM